MRKHNGTALISALFITTIAAIVATTLFLKQHLLIQQSQWVTRSDQMTLDLELVSDWAMQQIQVQNTATHFIPLAHIFPEKNVRGITVRGLMEDAQGKFNLNNLSNSDNHRGFAVFLHYLNPTLSIEQGLSIAKSIENSISRHPTVDGAPYQITAGSDLHDIPEVSSTLIDTIKPYVTALPVTVPINVNSASAAVLLTVNPALTSTQAENIVECRRESGGFFRVEDFIAACVSPQHDPSFGMIATQSQYYELTATAVSENQTIQMSSLLKAQSNDTKNPAIIVWQVNSTSEASKI